MKIERPTREQIARMPRAIAQRHFDGRWRQILEDAAGLPFPEQLRLAADMADHGKLRDHARAIAARALRQQESAPPEVPIDE